ncbi:MAG: LPS export ABC transporter periplasmic protein LptC [Desulfobacterales bacterium]
MATKYKKPKKLKIFLLATIFVTLGGVIGIYIGFKQNLKIAESVQPPDEPDAALSIGKIHQTATRNGKKEWSLEADSAHYMEKSNQMVLKDIKVVFFLKDKSEINLKADQGILKIDSNDIEVSGNVVLKNQEYELLTEKLAYAHDRRLLYSKAPATIFSRSAQVAADSMSLDLSVKKLTLEGSVETIIDQNFAF